MYKNLIKNGTGIAMIAGTVISLLALIFAIVGVRSAGYEIGTDLTQVDTTNLKAFDFALMVSIILIFLTVLIFLWSSVSDLFLNFKTNKKMILGILVGIVLFIVLYATSSYEVGGKWDHLNKEFNITEGISKFISAGLKTSIILTVIAGIAFVYSEVSSMFK